MSKFTNIMDWLWYDATTQDLDILARVVEYRAKAPVARFLPPPPAMPNEAVVTDHRKAEAGRKASRATKPVPPTPTQPVKVRKLRAKSGAKPKTPKEPKALPHRAGNNATPRKGMARRKKGLTAQAMEVLRQTTGKMGSTEVAEFMGISPVVASNVLSAAVWRKVPGLRREPAKIIARDGRTTSQYVYWLDGGMK